MVDVLSVPKSNGSGVPFGANCVPFSGPPMISPPRLPLEFWTLADMIRLGLVGEAGFIAVTFGFEITATSFMSQGRSGS